MPTQVCLHKVMKPLRRDKTQPYGNSSIQYYVQHSTDNIKSQILLKSKKEQKMPNNLNKWSFDIKTKINETTPTKQLSYSVIKTNWILKTYHTCQKNLSSVKNTLCDRTREYILVPSPKVSTQEWKVFRSLKSLNSLSNSNTCISKKFSDYT